MSDDKKNLLSESKGLTTGGVGAVLTTIVPLIAPDSDSAWRPLLYALAPLVSAFLTYIMIWVINRHGLESPAEAALRNSLNRDLNFINEQLKSSHLTEEFRKELINDREKTIRDLANIGKSLSVTSTSTTSEED